MALANIEQEKLTFQNRVDALLQEVIMCASLVDKLPNLAGLSRTCEIFGAQSLRMLGFSAVAVVLLTLVGCAATGPAVTASAARTRSVKRRRGMATVIES